MSYVAWLRERVGRRKVILVYATVIVWDEYGRILIQQRTDFDVWGLPGGVMEPGETLEACARRELREETGLMVGELRVVGVYSHPDYDVAYPNGDAAQQFTVCFAGRVTGGVGQADGVETKAQQFCSLGEIGQRPLLPWYRRMLADLAREEPHFDLAPGNGTVDHIAAVRPLIGRDLLIAPGAKVAVVRGDGRMLWVQRADNGWWVLPAGFMDIGETVAQTAVRETWEETGYHVRLERMIGIYSGAPYRHTYPNGDVVQNVGVMFRATLVDQQQDGVSAETADMAWLTLAEAEERMAPGYAIYFDAVRHYWHNGLMVR